jgi:hypothetical protein
MLRRSVADSGEDKERRVNRLHHHHDRASRRAFKLRRKLGGTGGLDSYIPKPKWMREATYDRKLEEIFAAEEIIYAHMEIPDRKLDRLLGR